MVTWVGATNGASPPPQPAHDIGDLVIVTVSGKPETVGDGVLDQGFTFCGKFTGGTGSAAADAGPTYIQVFAKVATDTTTTAPTATSGFAGSNNATWAIYAFRPDSGKTWRDTIGSGAAWMVGGSDTDTTADNLLAATTSAFGGGFVPDGAAGDGLLLVGCAQSDAGSTIGTVAASATGLSGGTHTARSYVETNIGNDSCSTGHTWLGFSGTPSTGVAISHTITGLGAPTGTVVAIAIRQTGPQTIAGGQAVTTSTGQAGSVSSGQTIVGGLVTVAATAAAGVALVGALVAGGQASTASTAQAGSVVTGNIIAGGQASTSSTAQAGTVVGAAVIAGGQATTVNAGTAGTIAQTIAGGTVTTTSTGQAGNPVHTVTGGQVTVTATVMAGSTGATVVAGGQAVVNASALPGTVTAGYLDTDTDNNVYAIMLSGDADVVWEPAVVARPALSHDYIEAQVSARKIDDFDLNGAGGLDPDTLDETVVSIPRHRDRIVIGNVDWTFKDGQATALPEYELLDPFMYGDGGTLILPSVNARFERLGVGRLKRVKLGATVKYQRVDEDTNEVVATDYKGFVLREGRVGDQLALAVGGELLGRAALKWHPAPIFRKLRDAAIQLGNSVVGMGLRSFGRFDEIGINLPSRGGMYEDQYLLDSVAQLTTVGGGQYTMMPDASGAYGLSLKDTETIHATVYFDNEFATADLGNDLAEKTNTVWINAVAPDGQRIMNASAPNLQAGEVPEYPTVGGNPMTIDDTDEDTSTGIGVTQLIWRLTFTGKLDREDHSGGFDADVAEAVRDFQREAGCTNLTGSVDEETWDKLWDNLESGYSVQFAAQRPAVQDDEVQKFDRSGSGNIIGRHEGYDEHAIEVHLPLDMGPVASRRQAFRMARRKLHQVGESDWVGTITLTDGLIEGEHNPGDPLTADMVIPNRAVRPGWNVWEPYFDNGTLFHVVACRVRDNGWTVELVVDTRARPAMEAWAVHQRNRENRYQVSRYLGGHRRRSVAVQDTVNPWDKIVGQTDRDWTLTGGQWTEIPIPSGQVGTVQQTEIALEDAAEFAVLVTERPVPLGRLNRKVLPLEEVAADETPWYEQAAIRNWLRVYRDRIAWGTFRQPCGYDPRAKTNAQGVLTGAPVTGEFFDESSFGYDCGVNGGVLYMYIWVTADNVLPRQRVFRQQLDGSGT